MTAYLIRDIYSGKYFCIKDRSWYTWSYIKENKLYNNCIYLTENSTTTDATFEGSMDTPTEIVKINI